MDPHSSRQLRRDAPRQASRIELAVFALGLVAAVVAGVAGYRVVGLYGDGAFAAGYHRERDPETGQSMLVHVAETSTGRVRRVIDPGLRVAEVRLDLQTDAGAVTVDARPSADGVTRAGVDTDRDGVVDRWEYYDAEARLLKVGFSLASDGVEDAWAYHDADGQLARIEVSTRRDGAINRWEFYANGRMTRVEEDTDRDGKPDRWSRYEEGILVESGSLGR